MWMLVGIWEMMGQIKNQPLSEVTLSPMYLFSPILMSIWFTIPKHLYVICWKSNYSLIDSALPKPKDLSQSLLKLPYASVY